MQFRSSFSRRRFVALAVGGTASAALAPLVRADSLELPAARERSLELKNTHTGEAVTVAFGAMSALAASTVAKLEHVLRDHRSGDSHPMDRALYQQLVELAELAGAEPRYEIISGYRSPTTNANLANNSSGVARRSLHMEGRAIDVRLKGVRCADLRDLALGQARGGVGFYRASDFVHLDTGRVRAWAG
jgi:uncharacterized protein YcbK (DUF882 family)